MEQDRKKRRRKQNSRPRALPLDPFFDQNQPRHNKRDQDHIKHDKLVHRFRLPFTGTL